MESIADYWYKLEKQTLERELISLTEYKQTNQLLRSNDWLFVCPLFFQGFELKYFHGLLGKAGPHKKIINQIIFNKFFDLGWTASFVEGYCVRCDHIAPFSLSIEQSLILTFQRDYEGAIKTLIPIVEGVIRKYLCEEKGMKMHEIRFQHVRSSFREMKKDLLTKYESGLSHRTDENKKSYHFTSIQKDGLLKLKTDYYNQWFSFITDFIDNSFYLKTDQQNTLTNQINRHAILHEFGLTFNYNLENYIKVYFVLQFLVWIFLDKEVKSPLNEIDGYRLFEKVEAYEKIIEAAERVSYQKHILLKNSDGYDESLFKEKFNIKGIELPSKYMVQHKLLVKTNELLWRKNLEV